jgi:LacI family transcriptional regulator
LVAVTLKDVAKRAGVSFATVSRVLSGRRPVQAEVAERVLEAAKALNYVPDRRARSLKLRRSDVIGIIVADIRQEFIPPVVRAIEDVASARGFAVLLCNADDNRDKELAYADLLLQEGVAGAVIAATADRAGGARRLVEGGIPVVAFDRKPDALAVDSVTVDNRGGAEQAVRHLLAVGYRRIALLAGLQAVGTARERRRGYEAAHAEVGLPVDPELVRDELREAEEATATAAKLLDAPHPPDALFTTNARLAAGALAALRERNLRLGDDIGFVTFDDPAWALLLERPLSAVAQPTYEIGRTAAEALFARIAGGKGPVQHIVLPPTLIIRTSMPPTPGTPHRTKRGTP